MSAEIAATLAHAALAFQDKPTWSARYWEKAKRAYYHTGVARATFGNSNEAYPDLALYYSSSGMLSHVFFAAASMWQVCTKLSRCGAGEAEVYYKHAMKYGQAEEYFPEVVQKWFWESPGWDNAWCGAAALGRAACMLHLSWPTQRLSLSQQRSLLVPCHL